VLRPQGRLARYQGHLEDGERFSTQALQTFQQLGELHQVGHVHSDLGEVAREGGILERAAEHFAQGLALLTKAGCEEGVCGTTSYLAWLARDNGDAPQARDRASAALRFARDIGLQPETPACLELLASLVAADDPQRAVCLLGAADAFRNTMGIALEVAERTERDRALDLTRGRLPDDTRAAAWNAGTAMTLNEAVKYALEPVSELNQAGAARKVPQLSPREAEVVALIGRGLSNREIAEELVIAERTAEAHVTHVLDKLGLRSRAQVAIWAHEHGLATKQSR
jgi:DNA-binding CsgD family transcriptional regulator